MGLATNVQYATEVTLQPLDRYRTRRGHPVFRHPHRARRDGAGAELRGGRRSQASRPLRDEKTVGALQVPDLEKLRYVFDAVTSIRRALRGRVPLIGFSGSPWTLACYMVGAPAPTTTAGSRACFTAGRTWCPHPGGECRGGRRLPQCPDRRRRPGRDDVRQLGRRARRRRVPAIQPGVHSSRAGARKRKDDGRPSFRASCSPRAAGSGSRKWGTGLRGVGRGLDREPRPSRALVGREKTLQGNLDPTVCSPAPQVAARPSRYWRSFGAPHTGPGKGSSQIFNLGHGISQHTPPEHVKALVDAVHGHSAAHARHPQSRRKKRIREFPS